MEPDQQDMREKRIQAVMKLKRAASLPRMADGRRPPMHPEGVSDGERMQAQESQMPGEGEVVPELPTEEQREPVAEPERQQEDEVEEEEERPEPEPEPEPTQDQDMDVELETPEPEPEEVAQETRPATRPAKRRSRSRSRSRGSKDFKGKARAALSPTPTLQLNGGDSSLDEALPFDVPSPMPSPMPAQLFELQRLRMLRSPTPMSTDPPQSPFNANMFIRNPALPTLEALQKGLIRSNSTNSRAEALRKLTGGTDTYDPTPMAGLSRNNTVTGGERLAARNALFNLIGGRITKETDNEQFSGSDERPTPEPTPKRKRRRSRRGSLAQANAGASEGDIDSSSPPPPPSIPPTPTPPVLPTVPPIRSLSRPTTPHIGEVRSWEQHPNRDNMPSTPDPRPSETTQSYEPAGNGLRRRSVVVEEDDDDNVPTSPPIHYDTTGPAYQVQMRNSPQLPWNRASPFPQHQQQRPYVQEVPTTDDDEEEQVLFGAETHRARTPFMDNFDREISWIADPVPELGIRIVDDKDTDEEEPIHEELGTSSPPLSPASFSAPEGENPTFGSPSQASLGSKSLLVESETSPPSPSSNLPQSSSGTALAHIIAPPIASANSSSSMTQPAVSPSIPYEHTDVEERAVTESGSKRNGELSTWEKVKGAFRSGTGRRSRTNSIARRDQRESSVSHESGVSHISTKVERGEMASAPTTPQHQGAPILAQANSTSGSMMSLGPPPSRGGPSPIPPASSADMLKYRDAKLFPFPGIHKLEQEQRDRRKIGPSTSTPDILSFPRGNDEENPPVNAASSPPTPQHAATEIGRERKLSQKNSDSQLAKTSNSFRDHIPFLSRQSSTTQASETGGLPKTLADVRQYMLSRDGSRGRSTSRPGSPGKPHLTLPGQPLELEDWEEVRLTPVSQSGSVDSRQNENKPREATETESTPKGKKVYKDVNSTTTSPSPPSVPSSRPDPFSSATPDPSSSLSDYPAQSTSESSSTNSSRYSAVNRHQGPALLEKLTEDLNHGTLSRLSSSIDEDQKRRLLLSSQVFQVVNANTLKDRFLFLFSDILVIAKPVMSEQDAHDSYRTNPTDKRFVVKSIVQLSQLRWTADRTDAASDPNTYNPLQNPTMKAFITNFSRDPEHAISVLQVKSGVSEDPVAVGQLLFRTPDLDRFRLGEYLVKRSAKGALRAYLDHFEFKGMRIDDALRVFLLSMNIPGGLTSHNSGFQYLLDAFASRWYEANATVVDFDKDCAHLLVRATIQLNDLLHGTQSRERVPYSAFAGAFRRYDSRLTVSEKLLEDIYISISNEKLFQACSLTSSTVPIVIKRAVPPRLTWKMQSDPIILRLPHADPDLQIKLDGQELEFDPPILTFARSPEASFRVKGLQLGLKSIIFRRMGPNADRYTGLPLSSPVVVERAFMRHTFQIAFKNHHGSKRHYMFSVEDSLLRHQWVSYFKQHVDTANNKSPSGANGHNKFKRAIDLISFKALQDTLIASPPRSANVVSKAIQRLNMDGPNQQNGHRNGDFLHTDSPSHHTRSKSRSKFYHQQGVGKHEATFLSGQEGTSDRDESESESRNLGPIWSARDLELHCRHNGSVASVVMNFLEKDKESNNS